MKSLLTLFIFTLSTLAGANPNCLNEGSLQVIDKDRPELQSLDQFDKYVTNSGAIETIDDIRLPIDHDDVMDELKLLAPAVGKLIASTDVENHKNNCTFTLLSPSVVITNAHCLESAEHTVEMFFNYSEGKYSHRRTALNIPIIDRKRDHAIIILNEPVKDITPIVMAKNDYEYTFPIIIDELDQDGDGRYDEEVFAWDMPGYLMGYNADEDLGKNGEVMTVDQRCTMNSVDGESKTAWSNCITYKGSSGAPMLAQVEEKMTMVGLHFWSSGGKSLRRRTEKFIKVEDFRENALTIIKSQDPEYAKNIYHRE